MRDKNARRMVAEPSARGRSLNDRTPRWLFLKMLMEDDGKKTKTFLVGR